MKAAAGPHARPALPQARGGGPEAPLQALERLASAAGAEEIALQARELGRRVAEGRFFVVCVGQFKRGKSTLLNALVGRTLLPTGVPPVTSAVTVLRHGPRLSATVRYADGSAEEVAPERLAAYVTEAGNPENRKGVRAVELLVPSPLLAGGMCLVDTPGLGSVFGGNTAVTRDFVPHVDAALVVVGGDPPISGGELQLVEEIAERVQHLVFALNKADRLTDPEREEGKRFAAQILSRRLRRPPGAIHEVSAAERLERGTPTRDWAALESAIGDLAREAGAELVRGGEARGVQRLGRALVRELAERRDALSRPVEESERRLALLRQSVAATERAREDLGVLLGAEQGRLAREFRERQEAFYPRAREEARRELEVRLRSLGGASRARLRALGYRVAQQVAEEFVERWRRQLEPLASELYRRSAERFVTLANEFLERMAASGQPGLEALPQALEPEAGFRAQSRLHYTRLLSLTTDTLRWLLDLVRPRERTLRALVARVGRYLDLVLEANSSRVANDLAERVAESRVRLEADVRGALRQVVAVAERALREATERRARGEAAVRDEVGSLEALSREVRSMLEPGTGLE